MKKIVYTLVFIAFSFLCTAQYPGFEPVTKTYNTMADLRASIADNGNRVTVNGFYTAGDGGGGTFIRNSSSAATVINGMIEQTTGVTTGRWIRVPVGEANVKWFGGRDDGVTSCVPALKAMIALHYNRIVFPMTTGKYLVDSTVTFTNDVTVLGDRFGATIVTNINNHSDVFKFTAKADVRNLYMTSSTGLRQNFVGIHIKIARYNLDNVRITAGGLGLNLDYVWIGTANNCFIANCDTGFVAFTANGADLNINVENCKKGFQMTNSSSVFFRACTIEAGDGVAGQVPVPSTIDNSKGVSGVLYFEGSDETTFQCPHLVIGGISTCYGIDLTLTAAVVGGNQYPIVLDRVQHAHIIAYIKVGASSARSIKTTANTVDLKVQIEHTGAVNTNFTDSSGIMSRHLNYFPNSHFDTWFNGWSAVGVNLLTVSKENTIVRRAGSNAVRLSLINDSIGTASIKWHLQSPTVERLRTKKLTMFAWIWVPTITELRDQPVDASDTTQINIVTQLTSNNLTDSTFSVGTIVNSGKFIKGDWNLMSSTVTVLSTATDVQLRILFGNKAYVSDGNEYIVVSDVYLMDDDEDNDIMNGEVSDALIAMNHFHGNLNATGTGIPNDIDQYYNVGDVVYNSAMTVGGNVGWICVTAGNVGTWIPLANAINNGTTVQVGSNFNIDGTAKVTNGTFELWERNLTNKHRYIMATDSTNSQYVFTSLFSAGGGWGIDYRFGATTQAHFYPNGHYYLGNTPSDNGFNFEVQGTSKFDSKVNFQSNSTTTGVNFGGIATDPATILNGDVWFNTTSNSFKYKANSIIRTFANLDEVQAFTNKTGNISMWTNNVGYLINPMTTLGDIPYENATPVPSRLVGNTSTTKKFLSQTGNGTISAAPVWNSVLGSDLVISDVTTNDVTTTAHGFAPKLPNDATKYLDGTGIYSVPATGGSIASGGLGKTSIGTNKFPFSTNGSTYSEGTARQGAEQTYTITGSLVWNGTAPTGTLTATYRWTQSLNVVTVRFYFVYVTPGATNTNVTFDLPADLPAPEKPTGFTADNNSISQGFGGFASSLGSDVGTSSRVALHNNSASSTGYSVSVSCSSISAKAIECTITYFTASGF